MGLPLEVAALVTGKPPAGPVDTAAEGNSSTTEVVGAGLGNVKVVKRVVVMVEEVVVVESSSPPPTLPVGLGDPSLAVMGQIVVPMAMISVVT